MKERPLLMRGPLVLATLEDRKWQTRRVIVPQRTDDMGWLYHDRSRRVYAVRQGMTGLAMQSLLDVCPYGTVGDHLWIRETWQVNHVSYDRGPIPKARPSDIGEYDVLYRADGEFWEQFEIDEGGSDWRPSIHMPRWASRLTLEITALRVERVQDISEEDAIAEGVDRGADPIVSARYSFGQLWNEINTKRGYGWEANPWVWVLEYRRVEL